MNTTNKVTTEEHYLSALQRVGVELKTHDVYICHLLGENTPPFITRDVEKVKTLMNEYGNSMVVYMNPCHEVDNVVYIGSSHVDYTHTLTPFCTTTGDIRGFNNKRLKGL